MEARKREKGVIPDDTKGPPLAAFIILVIAILYMGGIAFAFQGSIHF